jgi:AbrB family looped-hinge helix DNA binding protein
VLLRKITSRGQVTIPREVREKLKARIGDFVAFNVTSGGVGIRVVDPLDREWHAALAATVDEWSSPEDREAWRDL